MYWSYDFALVIYIPLFSYIPFCYLIEIVYAFNEDEERGLFAVNDCTVDLKHESEEKYNLSFGDTNCRQASSDMHVSAWHRRIHGWINFNVLISLKFLVMIRFSPWSLIVNWGVGLRIFAVPPCLSERASPGKKGDCDWLIMVTVGHKRADWLSKRKFL